MPAVWNFGNTTVRNPHRIQQGLALFAERFQGNVHGEEAESRFAQALVDTDVVDSDGSYSSLLGRKWRSAFVKLGFCTDAFGASHAAAFESAKAGLDLKGLTYEVTPAGRHLLQAKAIGAIQDVFLRQLVCHEIPSPVEPGFRDGRMKPLVLLLDVLHRLHRENQLGLDKVEVGAFLQVFQDHTASTGQEIVKRVLASRTERAKCEGRISTRTFEMRLLEDAAHRGGVKPETLVDYADTTFRYAKMTGLVEYRGSRMVVRSDKLNIADALLKAQPVFVADRDAAAYLQEFYSGATLPTDESNVAYAEVCRLSEELSGFGKEVPAHIGTLTVTHPISQLEEGRYELIELLVLAREEAYAAKHQSKEMIEDVVRYLRALPSKRVRREMGIPDAPSYLEWAVWRSFLAIDHLKCRISDTRRFPLDEDLLPRNPAPSGGPDMVFEFKDYVLVVEVTMLSSSRQEAAEGEPVRRHVAGIQRDSQKPVYAMFVAPSVDNNTAETFRIGVWYRDDKEDYINIVPLSLDQFADIVETLLTTPFSPKDLQQLLDRCLAYRNVKAPQWIRQIGVETANWMASVTG